MKKDDNPYFHNQYIITKEEAKSMKLIPLNHVWHRIDPIDRKFKVYFSNNDCREYRKFKTFEEFFKGKDGKCVVSDRRTNNLVSDDDYFVYEHNKYWILTRCSRYGYRDLRKYVFSDYYPPRSYGVYTTKEDIEKFIKVNQKEVNRQYRQDKKELKERKEILGYSEEVFNF